MDIQYKQMNKALFLIRNPLLISVHAQFSLMFVNYTNSECCRIDCESTPAALLRFDHNSNSQNTVQMVKDEKYGQPT